MQWGLSGMLLQVYQSSPYAALVDLLPDLQPWQMKMAPLNYWEGAVGRERARQATRWLLAQLDLSNASPAAIVEQVNKKVLQQFGLGGSLYVVYRGSPYALLVDVLPDLKPWQMKMAPLDYWKGPDGRENARAAVRWMVDQLNLATALPATGAAQITQNTFVEWGLGGMLHHIYRNSPYEALHDLFPALRPWQMKQTPWGYWRGETGRENARTATRWLLTQLNLTDQNLEQLLAVLTRNTFREWRLFGMLHHVYNESVRAALIDALDP